MLFSGAAILLSGSPQPSSVELLSLFQAWRGPSWGLEIVLSLLSWLIALMHPECIWAAAPNHWVIIYSQACSPLSSLLLALTLQGVNAVWLAGSEER